MEEWPKLPWRDCKTDPPPVTRCKVLLWSNAGSWHEGWYFGPETNFKTEYVSSSMPSHEWATHWLDVSRGPTR